MAMGVDKAADVRGTGAEVLIAGRHVVPDAHRRAARRGSGSPVRVMHLAEILAATGRPA